MNKKAAILLICFLLIILTACAGQTKSEDTGTDPAAASGNASAEEEPENTTVKEIIDTLPLSRPKTKTVGLITSEGGMDDESFNQNAWEGLQRVSGEYSCNIDYLETSGGVTFKENIDKMIATDPALCWGIGYSCSQDMLDTAKAYPDRAFAIVDNTYETIPDNMTTVVFRGQEPAFLAGFIAANMTQTGQIGFIGGEQNVVIDQFRYGFQGGVKYASAKLGSEVEVKALYADTFSDESKGRELADKLYADGCDIVFQAAGATGKGVITSAKEHGTYVIGIDKDQSYLAPENVLTSVLKYISVAIFTTTGDYLTGNDIGGSEINLGLKENAMGISGVHNLYPDELYDEAMNLAGEIIAGSIVPPSTEDEYIAFAP